MTKARRIAWGVGSLVALQGAIIAMYLSKRAASSMSKPATFSVERLSSPAPALRFAHLDGTTGSLSAARGKPVLVHFWGTWCGPCRAELPGLLAYAEELKQTQPFELIAIAVDDDWQAIQTFFGGAVPSVVVRPEDARAHLKFGASTLPDSYLVASDGQLLERYHGHAPCRRDRAVRTSLTRRDHDHEGHARRVLRPRCRGQRRGDKAVSVAAGLAIAVKP